MASKEAYRPSRSDLSNTAYLPPTQQLADQAASVQEPLSRAKWQFVDCVCLKHVMHVLVQTLLLENIANCIVEIWRKLSLSLLSVGKRLAPGVVDLIVPAVCEALANLSLEAMIV